MNTGGLSNNGDQTGPALGANIQSGILQILLCMRPLQSRYFHFAKFQ